MVQRLVEERYKTITKNSLRKINNNQCTNVLFLPCEREEVKVITILSYLLKSRSLKSVGCNLKNTKVKLSARKSIVGKTNKQTNQCSYLE